MGISHPFWSIHFRLELWNLLSVTGGHQAIAQQLFCSTGNKKSRCCWLCHFPSHHPTHSAPWASEHRASRGQIVSAQLLIPRGFDQVAQPWQGCSVHLQWTGMIWITGCRERFCMCTFLWVYIRGNYRVLCCLLISISLKSLLKICPYWEAVSDELHSDPQTEIRNTLCFYQLVLSSYTPDAFEFRSISLLITRY